MPITPDTAEKKAELKQLKLDAKAAAAELKTIDLNMRNARRAVAYSIKRAQANLRSAEREANALRKGIAARQQRLQRRMAIVKGRLA